MDTAKMKITASRLHVSFFHDGFANPKRLLVGTHGTLIVLPGHLVDIPEIEQGLRHLDMIFTLDFTTDTDTLPERPFSFRGVVTARVLEGKHNKKKAQLDGRK